MSLNKKVNVCKMELNLLSFICRDNHRFKQDSDMEEVDVVVVPAAADHLPTIS